MKTEEERRYIDNVKRKREAIVKKNKVVKKDEHPRTERQ